MKGNYLGALPFINKHFSTI